MSWNNTDAIDKDEGIIRLKIGQICSSAGGDQYVEPFEHEKWDNENNCWKKFGLAIRISNDGFIISNPCYRGIAIIAFLDRKYAGSKILSVKVTKINKRSVCVEPQRIV